MITYRYTIEGLAARDQTWSVAGLVRMARAGDFQEVIEDAQLQTFQALTEGKAVYGHPGVGCAGPYRITKLIIEEEHG